MCLCLTCRVLLALAGDVKNRGTIVQQGGAKVRVCDLGICAREGGGGGGGGRDLYVFIVVGFMFGGLASGSQTDFDAC